MLVVAFVPISRSPGHRAPVADFVTPAHAAEAAVARAQREEKQRAPARPVNAPSAQDLPADQAVYFAQSGQHLTDRYGFLSFWRKHGSLLIFGFPISEEVLEQGQVVQYFERARFELHPEYRGTEAEVLLGLLGLDVLPCK
jgi:hypothetical protein